MKLGHRSELSPRDALSLFQTPMAIEIESWTERGLDEQDYSIESRRRLADDFDLIVPFFCFFMDGLDSSIGFRASLGASYIATNGMTWPSDLLYRETLHPRAFLKNETGQNGICQR